MQKSPANEKGHPVLVIDDEPSQLKTIADILETEELQPICCRTGKEALQACKQYDVIVAILDLRLPDMDGLEVLRELRRQNPEIKVIINTGYASLESAMAAVNEEAYAYVKKMGDVGELLAHVHRAFHAHLTGYSERLEQEVKKRAAELLGVNRELRKEIAERKHAEVALRESEQKYRTLVESTTDAIVSIDSAGDVVSWNKGAQAMFGYTPEEILGKASAILLHERQQEKHSETLRKVRETGSIQRLETVTLAKDGTRFPVEMNLSAIMDDAGMFSGVSAIIRDITERKQAEKERERLEKQLRHAQKMETVGTLAGGIAHDFNNILQAIHGFVEMCLEDVPPGSQTHDDLQEVMKATNRARDLVQQLLTFSRHEIPERRPVRLRLIVREALKLLQATLPSSIEIRRKINRRCGIVRANAGQIHQVVMNLCTNAYQAMGESGGVLEVRLDRVAADAAFRKTHPNLTEKEYVRLTVSDTGQGMSRATLERMFDPFFTTREVDEGTGLGLSVVHGIVTAHGGEITVDSEPGKGSTFRAYFPVTEMTAEQSMQFERKIVGGHERILFVDDEEIVASVIKRSLERLGYQITTRSSGADALETFRARTKEFDLVIADQIMPQMTGVQLARELLRLRPDLPIILMSGFSERITPELIKATGIREFIMKPVVAGDLSQAIQRVVATKQDKVTNGERLKGR